MIPIEWLNELIQERDGFRRLLNECGSLPRAAHRLALAKCMTDERYTSVPTRLELRAAARQIANRVPGTCVPDAQSLAHECAALGLDVI